MFCVYAQYLRFQAWCQHLFQNILNYFSGPLSGSLHEMKYDRKSALNQALFSIFQRFLTPTQSLLNLMPFPAKTAPELGKHPLKSVTLGPKRVS